MITVELTKGYETLISPEDIHVLEHLWCVKIGGKKNAKPYAVRYEGRKVIYLHRQLCSPAPEPWQDVDHINGDTLDNRRCNLRPASKSLNALNRRGQQGVCLHKARNRWQAYITVAGVRTNLGWFKTEAEARAARRNAEERLIP